MRQFLRPRLGLIALAIALSSMTVLTLPAMAFDCPQVQSESVSGVIKETEKTISTQSQTLAARGSAAIPSMVFQLRKSHPAASNAAITNYRITAYCPVVNRKVELTEVQKKDALALFASQVRDQLR